MLEARTDSLPPDAAGRVIAGRYRIESEIARGGMGVVYRVTDQSTGLPLALKQLAQRGDDRVAAMFEREYRTLASLDHPRIIDVYDYGVAGGRAYYTMELLDGDDLRGLAPLPPRVACRYLRDVASSLALLHARRLLHRDLSPRNVRAVGDGHCKLLDFGALVAFGVSGQVVGTPPCIAPEALRGLPMDQRADLYSLGALAYWLLTGRHAYHAKQVHELPERWQRTPPAPSRVLAARREAGRGAGAKHHIPEELDSLVMALLSHDPLARPSNAAEVIERLNAIADLDAEPLPDVSRSYLSGAALSGRGPALERVMTALSRAVDGHGGCLMLVGPTGIGRTRMLGELAIQGQIEGAIVLRADGALSDGVYGTVRELARQLIAAAPDVALATARADAEILSHVSDELRAHLGLERTPRPTNETPGEVRKRTQGALRVWLDRVADELPVAILVDNLERADEPSAALLARLARDAHDRHLLLGLALDTRRPVRAAAAVSSLSSVAEAIRLRRLAPEQTVELVRSLLGDATGVPRLASWLHERTGGNPGACITLAEHLVQRGVLHHHDGAWVVPPDIELAELPASVKEANEARVDQLGADARRLYEALCVTRGSLPLELCVELARSEGLADPFAALEELTRRGLLEGSTNGYRFVSDGLRGIIEGRLDEARRAALHRTIGRHLLARARDDVNARMAAGFHLLEGGERERGSNILAAVGLELFDEADELPAAVPALEAALRSYREQGRSEYELALLLSPLCVAGYHTDLRLAFEYGPEAMALQQRVLGLGLAARLRPLLGRRLSTLLGLGYGATRHLLRRGAGGVPAFVAAVTRYVLCVMSLAGAATICLDAALTRRYAAGLEPLRGLGRAHMASVAHDFVLHLAQLLEDRLAESAAGFRRIIELFRRGEVRGVTPSAEALVLGGAWYAVGALEGFRDGAAALRCADELEGIGLRLYDMVAEQVRASFYANRGEVALADHHRQKVELHAIDAGSAWQAETWASSSMTNATTITRDMLGIKRATQQLDHLSERIPSLSLFADLARVVYATMRGNPRQAVELAERIRAEQPPQSYIGWSAANANLAQAYNELGEHEKALQICDETLALLSPEEMTYVALRLRILTHRAMAVAQLGRVEAATRELDALLARHGPAQGPMTCGLLHETRARVALLADDRNTAEHHAERMALHYRSTANPALIAFCQRFIAETSLRLHDEASDAVLSLAPLGSAPSEFHDCADVLARADRALDLLLRETGAPGGYLFGVQGRRIELLSPRHGNEPPPELQGTVEDELYGPEDITLTSAEVSESRMSTHRHRLCVLDLPEEGGLVVAVAALETGAPYTPPSAELLRMLARGVWDPSERGSRRNGAGAWDGAGAAGSTQPAEPAADAESEVQSRRKPPPPSPQTP